MEGTYACNLNNRFELFLDEENDPLEILAKSQQEKRKGTEKSKDTKKDAKKKGLSKTLKESVKTIAAAVDSNEPRVKAGSTSPTQGGGFGGAPRPPRRENLERRNNERNFEPRPEGDRPPRENRGPRDGNRPPRNFEGPRPEGGRNVRNDGTRGSRDGQRPGGRGREFDRHSGDTRSGVKSTEKRGGQGAHNWGKNTDQFDTTPEQELVVPENLDVTPEGVPEGVAAGEEPAVPAEPEAVQMTLEQWKKEQASKVSKAEYAANIRKPNEGEKEDPKLKKAVVLKKLKAGEEDSDDADGDDANDAEDECEKLKKELEQTLASQFHFADVRGPARGGRGGRSSGPPGPRRQEEGNQPSSRPPRGGKPQHTPRVEDLNDFPSLAA
ncbi:plasminogen activator inhibitor 1 RNA-binding protein [Galendromus occidentalis]|uniref:Plasminogen activator inhibitor 1 RNA-binding protein n=1 Tax=Galendromus occidentalis TaxID=34638 RepID=A0AAJ6QTJ7_9ACAR|nr:plasminogen activator inhibitor 1 RNA-binding protein [Galendromus occidentalis]